MLSKCVNSLSLSVLLCVIAVYWYSVCVQGSNFEKDQQAMKNQLMQLQILLTFVDPELANYLGQSVSQSVRAACCVNCCSGRVCVTVHWYTCVSCDRLMCLVTDCLCSQQVMFVLAKCMWAGGSHAVISMVCCLYTVSVAAGMSGASDVSLQSSSSCSLSVLMWHSGVCVCLCVWQQAVLLLCCFWVRDVRPSTSGWRWWAQYTVTTSCCTWSPGGLSQSVTLCDWCCYITHSHGSARVL